MTPAASWIVADPKSDGGCVTVRCEDATLRCTCGRTACWHQDRARRNHPDETAAAIAIQALQAIRHGLVTGDQRDPARLTRLTERIVEHAISGVAGEVVDIPRERLTWQLGESVRAERAREVADLFGTNPTVVQVLRDELAARRYPGEPGNPHTSRIKETS